MFAFHAVKRIFLAVKLRPQNPPIDKRETGNAEIPEERRIHTSPSDSPSQLGPLANERAVSSDFLVGKIYFSFSCEACSLYYVLLLSGNSLRCYYFEKSSEKIVGRNTKV